jgi:POT family proton-dependent oligopeptide transporter
MAEPLTPQTEDRSFFGHPRGLSTLFFNEMWERFSYYGMRALLVLFMTDTLISGGMGMAEMRASAIVGLYTFGVYALALPGGWMADRLFGQRKAVLYGGIIIALGHYTLAIAADWAFYSGLVLLVLGTGLLKPNVSAIVGDLYVGQSAARRDAGFSIFYMGINIGALAGPLLCGWLGEEIKWHYGFGAAGVGMTFGLIQYVIGWKHLRNAGNLKIDTDQDSHRRNWRNFYFGLASAMALATVFIALVLKGILPITLVGFARWTGVIVTGLVLVYFLYIIFIDCKTVIEQKRVVVIAALFFGAAMFWSGFEQASTALNLFAEDLTNRVMFDWEMPTTFLQSINPFFIIVLAPVVGGIWVKMGERNPSLGVKFGMGLVLLGVGFLVLAWGSSFTSAGRVSPMWLVVTYFFHTVGELCLSPVGLSAMTKLSPDRLVSQMMGIWFMGAALGNLIAGLVGGLIENMQLPLLFGTVASVVAGAGLLFWLLTVPIRHLAGGVK